MSNSFRCFFVSQRNKCVKKRLIQDAFRVWARFASVEKHVRFHPLGIVAARTEAGERPLSEASANAPDGGWRSGGTAPHMVLMLKGGPKAPFDTLVP